MIDYSQLQDELHRLTNEHWNRNDAEWYIRNLLPLEMECAQQQVEKCDTLALLIGFSEDPLLQTIWKYRPQRIVLVLNSSYCDNRGNEQKGKRRAEEWVEYIQLMAQLGFCPQLAVPRFDRPDGERRDIAIAAEEAKPDWIFRELRDRLLSDQRAGKQIVVDITGAKKNMASGAFLFAAYAGAGISYVDFGDYDPQKRRPLGYTCRIGAQPNPYRILGLRDWERVEKLYEQFAFGSAGIEVARLSKAMGDGLQEAAGAGTYFSEEQRQAVKRLEQVLVILDKWDNGDYTSAWQHWMTSENDGSASLQSQMPKFPLPHVIEYLGSRRWPFAEGKAASVFLKEHIELKRGKATPEDSIFNQPDLLLKYAFDERDKINRLIRYQNDYRSAFLRSAGLDELLLKARVAILWLTDQLQMDGNPNVSLKTDKARFDILAESPSAGGFRDFLHDPDKALQFRVPGGFTVRRKSGVSIVMTSYWQVPNCPIDHQTLVRLRGEAIHTHLSIPISYADAAYRIADCALTDFADNWVALLKKPVPTHQPWHLGWNDLCTHCGLDFLPALPQTKEQAT